MSPLNPRIQQCVRALHRGDCVAYPTEAVWGLGCDPFNQHAVERILRIKRRPVEKGLILAASDISAFAFLIKRLPAAIQAKVAASWPGHVTWLIPHYNLVPDYVSGSSNKVAVRVSAHPTVGALSAAFGGPIISTSANPAGQPSATRSFAVRRYFRQENLIYANGRVGSEHGASRIIDAETGEIYRS